jgi:diacylglycerol O-acyltransferase
MPLHIEPLSSVDSAWLAMEHPTNLMMVTGIMGFPDRLDREELQQHLKQRWLRFRRFRQRVTRPKFPFAPASWTMAFWETDPDFELDNHLHEVELPPPGDQKGLQEVVSALMSEPLDFARPPWSMHLIQGVEGGSALFIRVHHCIADGIALIHVLLSMTDKTPDALPPGAGEEEESTDKEDEDPPSLLEEAIDAIFQQATNAASSLANLTEKVVKETVDALANPSKAMELAKHGTGGAATIQRMLLQADDPQTLFKGTLGTRKVAAWSEPIPLDEVKQVKTALGGTVNDVLISAAAGGLRRFMLAREHHVGGLNFRAAIPVNLRKPEESEKLGDKFGLVFLSLPIGIEDPRERLAEVRLRMDELKKSHEAPLFLGLLRSLGYTPQELQSTIVNTLANKITAVMSNVPGPDVPLYMAGHRIDQLMFWVPQAGRVGLGVSILSYAGQVFLGVATDEGLVDDPQGIIEGFLEEYEALVALAGQEPAAAEVAPSPPESEDVTEPENAVEEPKEEAPACHATTAGGIACSNPAATGSAYCRVHRGRYES